MLPYMAYMDPMGWKVFFGRYNRTHQERLDRRQISRFFSQPHQATLSNDCWLVWRSQCLPASDDWCSARRNPQWNLKPNLASRAVICDHGMVIGEAPLEIGIQRSSSWLHVLIDHLLVNPIPQSARGFFELAMYFVMFFFSQAVFLWECSSGD